MVLGGKKIQMMKNIVYKSIDVRLSFIFSISIVFANTYHSYFSDPANSSPPAYNMPYSSPPPRYVSVFGLDSENTSKIRIQSSSIYSRDTSSKTRKNKKEKGERFDQDIYINYLLLWFFKFNLEFFGFDFACLLWVQWITLHYQISTRTVWNKHKALSSTNVRQISICKMACLKVA